MDANDLRRLLACLSNNHALKRGGISYLDGFAAAFMGVYTSSKRRAILQKKFFIPDESRYGDETFYASASELTVANHVRQQSVGDFAVDKRVNLKNRKDVDVSFSVGSTEVAVEVKCPVEAKPEGIGGDGMQLLFKTAGRVPDHIQQLVNLKDTIESAGAGKVTFGKNRDLTLKDFLLSANAKFSAESSVGNLNIMFLAGGYVDSMSDFYMNLYGGEGLFTDQGFHPSSEFALVDVVMLSNLKYWHEHAAAHHDWTLRNVLLLPRINTHARPSLMSESIRDGLSVFEHHLQAFNNFTASAGENVPDYVLAPLKLTHYVNEHMPKADRRRYFPIELYPLGKAPPPHREDREATAVSIKRISAKFDAARVSSFRTVWGYLSKTPN
jgi:hypothetical protein